METISQADFSRMQGVSRARVSQWIKDGTISLELDGRIDPAKAGDELEKNLDLGKRLDWETSSIAQAREGRDGPPHPFTGNLVKDMTITTLTFFYEHYINIMVPILLKLFMENFHADKESAQEAVICFGFKAHEIVKNFLEKDIFDKRLRSLVGIGIDQFWGEISGRKMQRTSPPKHFRMGHPEALLKLLKRS